MRALLFLLISLPAFAAGPVKLASPGLSLLNLDEKMATFYTDHMGSAVKQAGVVELVTPREIASLLGMERQKQLLGCSDSAGSCVAELANALGADGVVLGDIARVGTRYQVNLKVISASDGKTLALFQEGATSEEAVLDMLTRGGNSLREQTLKALGRTAVAVVPVTPANPSVPAAAVTPAGIATAPVKSSGLSRNLAFIPMGVGGAALIGGIVGLAVSESASAELATASSDGAAARDRGRTANTLGVAGVIGGTALVGGGLLWFLLAGPDAPAVSVAPGPGGGAVSVRGSF